MKKLRHQIKEGLSVNESTVEGRETFEGVKYHIMYESPRGYYIKGADVDSKDIFKGDKSKFEKYDQAKEHAELSIKGALDD